ncbi:hypothetical protein H310_05335 [Aphanomyces invadans]|uniref:Uncharacterized protein n=1 Tax=Aphanomyces invadans TaxID=157072 RepID=A0A024UB58_9STRA|nr:hypothetical protein H310_05335 [Aphanomyces invadans]ETW02858.1 hypothetical protein H310_05335 [Aphanomyces invadans]|eukprot:XP_008868242.1 hypothetical protein H310_05335 [Aphanomyces invadans]
MGRKYSRNDRSSAWHDNPRSRNVTVVSSRRVARCSLSKWCSRRHFRPIWFCLYLDWSTVHCCPCRMDRCATTTINMPHLTRHLQPRHEAQQPRRGAANDPCR